MYPDTAGVTLKDGGVQLTAVFLYADLIGSTSLAVNHPQDTTARVIRGYLSMVTRILIHHNANIRSFDGDRVMGIFIGDECVDQAVRAAFKIRFAMENLLEPMVVVKFGSVLRSGWVPRSGVGIDIGRALIVRGGVRDHNDLVAIGDAPNIAAKLSEIRDHGSATTFVTERIWLEASWDLCFSDPSASERFWSGAEEIDLGGRTEQVRWSSHDLDFD